MADIAADPEDDNAVAEVAGDRFGRLIQHLTDANLLGQELREIGFTVKFNTYSRSYAGVTVEVSGPEQSDAAQ